MPIPTLATSWSAAVTITRETFFECREGVVYIAYGATPLSAPGSLLDGFRLTPGDGGLRLNGGQDFRYRADNPATSVLWYGEQGA